MTEKIIKSRQQGKINMNYLFLGIICVLLSVIAYLIGSSHMLSSRDESANNTTSQIIQSNTPTSVVVEQELPKQNYIYQQQPVNTPIPKKVTVTFTDPYINGTYYCSEEKANELVTLNGNLAVTLKAFNFCADNARTQGGDGSSCMHYTSDLDNLRKQLKELRGQYCP